MVINLMPTLHLFQCTTSRSLLQVLMHDVSYDSLPPQISNLFNYQHNIHSCNTRSLTSGSFFLTYCKLNNQKMSFSRNGVRIWNSFSDEFRQMTKATFKRNIHNMLLQKLLEANEYIDLYYLYMLLKLNLLYLHYHSSFSCKLFHFSINLVFVRFLCFCCCCWFLFSLSEFFFTFSFVINLIL